MTEPFLHLSDVGLVVEGVGGGRRAERVCADLEPQFGRIISHQLVNTICRDRIHEPSGAIITDRPEQRAILIGAVSGGVEVVVNERRGARMQRQIPCLAAFARHFEMRHAFARMLGVLDLELAQFLAAQRVEQQRGQDGAVALALDGFLLRRRKQLARLVIAAFSLRPFDTFDRVVGDGVLLVEIFEQRGE
jgi:hypothetical protein